MRIKEKIIAYHKFSSNHRESILSSKWCYCFYCVDYFKSSEIVEWIDNEQTALCPQCGIDAVFGDKDVKRVYLNLLIGMKKHWFSGINNKSL